MKTKFAIAAVILTALTTGCTSAPSGNNLSTLNDTTPTLEGYVLNDYCVKSHDARGYARSHTDTRCLRPAGYVGN